MDSNFWHQRWENNNIGFHESEANSLLVNNFEKLFVAKGNRVFVPLCGKTNDISWLLSNGYRVAGVELSKIAIEQLFINLGMEPKITMIGELTQYSAHNIDIYVGDIFQLSKQILEPIDATYDRAALVALPKNMRNQYAPLLVKITNTAPQLLISYEYDQNLMEGPPFSVNNIEISKHYGNSYKLSLIESTILPGGLKGKVEAKENVWLLQNYTQ